MKCGQDNWRVELRDLEATPNRMVGAGETQHHYSLSQKKRYVALCFCWNKIQVKYQQRRHAPKTEESLHVALRNQLGRAGRGDHVDFDAGYPCDHAPE